MNSESPVVFVVDDDHRVREALSSLISSVGLRVAVFGSAAEFLESERPDAPACLVLDLQLPGTSGLELQQQLLAGDTPPIVFISGHGDIPSSVRAIKAGAIEFLPKPFDDQELLRAIHAAIDQDRIARQKEIGTSRIAKALQPSHAARTGSPSLRGGGLRQQTDCRRPGYQRDHDWGSPGTDHAEDGREIAGRAGKNGRQTRNRPSRWNCLNKPIIAILRRCRYALLYWGCSAQWQTK